MLAIRFSRSGKNGQPHFRLIVQEKTLSPKKQAFEILGYYSPARQPKVFEIKEDRVRHWLKIGARPSDSVAALLKKKGFSEMDKFMAPRNKQHKKKKEAGKEPSTRQAAATPTAA